MNYWTNGAGVRYGIRPAWGAHALALRLLTIEEPDPPLWIDSRGREWAVDTPELAAQKGLDLEWQHYLQRLFIYREHEAHVQQRATVRQGLRLPHIDVLDDGLFWQTVFTEVLTKDDDIASLASAITAHTDWVIAEVDRRLESANLRWVWRTKDEDGDIQLHEKWPLDHYKAPYPSWHSGQHLAIYEIAASRGFTVSQWNALPTDDQIWILVQHRAAAVRSWWETRWRKSQANKRKKKKKKR